MTPHQSRRRSRPANHLPRIPPSTDVAFSARFVRSLTTLDTGRKNCKTRLRGLSGFQDIHPCLSFVGWHRSCIPSWRMYAGYRRWPPSSAVCCWQSNVLGQEITQPVWWPLFCHRRANAVEQSAWTTSATEHHLRTIQTIVENVYVWLVRPRRPVSDR